MYILKWFRFIIAKIYNILRYVIARILRHMCNLHINETEISQKRSKGIKNWNITYSVFLSVLSNKTNMILWFSSPFSIEPNLWKIHFSQLKIDGERVQFRFLFLSLNLYFHDQQLFALYNYWLSWLKIWECQWDFFHLRPIPTTASKERTWPDLTGSRSNFIWNIFEMNTATDPPNSNAAETPKVLNIKVQFVSSFFNSGKISLSLGFSSPSTSLKCPWRMCSRRRCLAPGISRGNPRNITEHKRIGTPNTGKPSHQAPIQLGWVGDIFWPAG